MEQNLLPWKTTESTVTPEWVASLLFISKMVGRYLLVHWCQFCQIHGIEKEKTRAWRHEKGLQVWEGQMFFRPKEREKKRGSLKERMKSEKNEARKRDFEEASREERQLLHDTGKIQNPSVFHPREKTRRVSGLCQSHTGISHRHRANEPPRRHRRHH